jgi:hypothetical protein
MTSGLLSRLPAIVIVLISATGVAAAQLGVARSTSGAPEAQRLGPGSGPGIGMTRPGFMMGPGMMRGTGMWNSRFDGPCDPSVAGIPEWRIDEIETRGATDGRATCGPRRLRTASANAAEELRTACPREIPQTSGQTHDVHGEADGDDAGGIRGLLCHDDQEAKGPSRFCGPAPLGLALAVERVACANNPNAIQDRARAGKAETRTWRVK